MSCSNGNGTIASFLMLETSPFLNQSNFNKVVINTMCFGVPYPANCQNTTSPLSCDICSINYFKRPDNFCYLSCDVTYFGNQTTRICEPCISNCDICPDSTQCTLCSSTYYQRDNGLCYTSCLSGTYKN